VKIPFLDRFRPQSREKVRIERPQRLHAKFDAAQTTHDNSKHWSWADSFGPNASADHQTRQLLRNRSRYESANNSFLRGMILTKVNFTIGRGPRCQMLTNDFATNKQIETDWRTHCRLTKFCRKLRTLLSAKYTDGEAFAVPVNSQRMLNRTGVSLDLRVYECDYVHEPFIDESFNLNHIDAVRLNDNGDPTAYWFLRQHPGAEFIDHFTEGDWIPSNGVYHLYREDRPGQRRGIPYTTPALPLFAIARRYSLATLHNAEWAAQINAVMKSTGSVGSSDVDEVDQLLSIPWARNMLMTLPLGWEVQQMKAEQPTETTPQFGKWVLNEASRCLEIPFNVAAANSSEMNMASGRIDHRLFNKANEIERSVTEDDIIEPYFNQWLVEYLAARSGIAPSEFNLADYPHLWGYDGFDEDDPIKVAGADIAYWDKGLLTDHDYWLRKNLDPEEQYQKLAEQTEKRTAINLPQPGVVLQQVKQEGSDDDGE